MHVILSRLMTIKIAKLYWYQLSCTIRIIKAVIVSNAHFAEDRHKMQYCCGVRHI